MPKVSIIVPNYNHASFLQERLDSIINQTWQDFELIIMDDMSIDNSKSVIEKYRNHPKVSQIIYNDGNSGSTFLQWEKGVAVAKNEIIWIAESDDCCSPKFLETLLPYFTDSNVGLVYCQSLKYNSEGIVTGSWFDYTRDLTNSDTFINDFKIKGLEYIEKFLIYKNTIPNASAVLFRKTIFCNVGGVKEGVKTNNDWLLWLKMLCKSDIVYISAPLNYFRYHQKSVIASANNSPQDYFVGTYDRLMRFEFKKYFIKHVNTLAILSLNNSLIADSYMHEGGFYKNKGHFIPALRSIIKASTFHRFTLKYIKAAIAKFL